MNYFDKKVMLISFSAIAHDYIVMRKLDFFVEHDFLGFQSHAKYKNC